MNLRERLVRVVLLVCSVALLAYLVDVFVWGEARTFAALRPRHAKSPSSPKARGARNICSGFAG